MRSPPALRIPLLLAAMVIPCAAALAAPRTAKQIAIAPVWGPIDRDTVTAVARTFETASKRGLEIVLLDIDSPGGDLDATERIVDLISAYPEMTFVVYISGRHNRGAWHAAAFLALSVEKIYIHPLAALGNARTLLALDGADETGPPNLLPPRRAYLRARAETRNHPRTVVEALITDEAELFLLETEGGTRPLSADEYRRLSAEAQENARLLKAKGAALTLTAREAEAVGLAEVIEPELLPAILTLLDDEHEKFARAWAATCRRKLRRQKRFIADREKLRRTLRELNTLLNDTQALLSINDTPLSRKELAALTDKLKKTVKLCKSLVKTAGGRNYFGPAAGDFEAIKTIAEAQLREAQLRLADAKRRDELRPNVRPDERGGRQNEYGFHPVYTFEAENHVAARRARKRRDFNASNDYAVSASGRRYGLTAVKVRPGGLPDGSYIARFVVRITGGVAFGSAEFIVTAGDGDATLVLDRDELRTRTDVFGYAAYDVPFSPGGHPITLTVTVGKMHLYIDRIEVWRKDDLFPPVIRHKRVKPGKPKRRRVPPGVIIITP